jgi:hypothetical protein
MTAAVLRRCLILIGLLAGVATDPAAARADDATLLTVAGKIANANRGAFDPFADAFLNSHDIVFDRAYVFDRAALLGLGMHRVTAKYPGSDRMLEVEGPLLRDVLAKAGAAGQTVSVMALDGIRSCWR